MLLAFNRDEFFNRPAQPLHVWSGGSGLVAGRDLDGGGTWLGVSTRGRVAFLTNFRSGDSVEPSSHTRKHASRGELTTRFLSGNASPREFTQALRLESYNGFNLVVGELRPGAREGAFVYVNNAVDGASEAAGGQGSGGAGASGGGHAGSGGGIGSAERILDLQSGRVYGLSNGVIGDWPKVTTGVQVMESLLPNITSGRPVPWERIYGELLGDSTRLLPPAHAHAAASQPGCEAAGACGKPTGGAAGAAAARDIHVGSGDCSGGGDGRGEDAGGASSSFERELPHLTSGRFVEAVQSPYGLYGTRCQTVIVVWHDGTGEARERHLHADGVWRESMVPLRMEFGG